MKVERTRKVIEKRFGGKGHLISDSILGGDTLGGGCRMYAEITLEVGCSLGAHEHHGESEAYFITHGAGMYNDNGKEYQVSAGDVLFCDDGEYHALENIGDEDLRFVALILEK